MMTIVEALELGYPIPRQRDRAGRRSRLTEDVPTNADLLRAPDNPREFDVFSPATSPRAPSAYLSSEDCAS